jgi:hypothetical protein
MGADIVAHWDCSAHPDQAGLIDCFLHYHKEELRLAGKEVFIQHGKDV